MKKTQQVAFAGVLCALATVCMLLTALPTATFALAALAGIVLMPASIELGTKGGVACYAVTAVLSLILVTDLEAKLLFITFFGYYPILQLRLVLWRRRVAAWVVRFAIFNVSMVASTLLLGAAIGFEALFEGIWWLPAVLLVLGNVVLVVFDIALTRLAALYRVRLHPHLKKLFR